MIYKVEGLSKIYKYHINLTTFIKGLGPVMVHQEKLLCTGSASWESVVGTENELDNL